MSLNNIIPNGTIIETISGNVEAIIIGVCIRGIENIAVEYQISYFYNGLECTTWLQEFQFKIKENNSKPAGFTQNNQKQLK